MVDVQSTPLTPPLVKGRMQSKLHAFFTVQASAASTPTAHSPAICSSLATPSSQGSGSGQDVLPALERSRTDDKRMPDAQIRERVQVCRGYDKMKIFGNMDKRIAQLCSEFPFLSRATDVANLVKRWKAEYKKFVFANEKNKIQTSRRHKGRVVLLQRVPKTHTKANSVWRELRDWLLPLLSNLRRECNIVTVERFHTCVLEDVEF